jgi:hypothetical protein
MKTSKFLSSPGFWIAIIILMAAILFLYGRSIGNNKTELAETRIALKNITATLDELSTQKKGQDILISKLNETISDQKNTLSKYEILIDSINKIARTLGSKASLMIAKPAAKTVYQDTSAPKYIEKIVYQEKPEPFHPYGKGMGNLAIYTTCKTGGILKVWIDGDFAGTMNKYQTGAVNCTTIGIISKQVLSGKHHIKARDESGKSWETYTTVKEDSCQPFDLRCSKN